MNKEKLVKIVIYPKKGVSEEQREAQKLLACKQAPSLARLLSKKFFYLYILFLLSTKERYGNEIITCLGKKYPIWSASPGAVYPLLKKMEQAKLISGTWGKGLRQKRCVYRITEKGKEEFKSLKEELIPYLKAATGLLDEVVFEVESGCKE